MFYFDAGIHLSQEKYLSDMIFLFLRPKEYLTFRLQFRSHTITAMTRVPFI